MEEKKQMEVFLTGATGYIGSAVAEALQKAGHKVTGLARTPEKAKQLEARGVRACMGDLLKPETVAAPARAADGVIHTANTNDANSAKADAVVARDSEGARGIRETICLHERRVGARLDWR